MSLAVAFSALFLLFFPSPAAAQSPKPTNFSAFSISQSPWRPSQNLVLLSPNSLFAAGFRPLPNNSNLFIFSVWYFNISTDNVVWSANRLHPVNGSAALVITATGQLRLNDGSGRNLWPFNNVTANSNSTQLILRDDGDLIYGTWESFQFPTNTILPNQTFNGTTIISNNGKYSFVNSVNLTFGTERYWWTDNPFKNFENTGQINRDNQNPIYPTDFNSTRLRKLVVDDDGNLKILSFDPNSPRWDMVWQAHVELCQIFHTCGPNSICMSSGSYNSTYCVCAPGFSPDPRGGARQGCNRKLNVSNKLKFLQLDFVNFRGGANQIFIQTPNISVCQANCLKNSSCVGYTFSFEGNDQCVLQLDMLSNGLWSPGMKTAAFVKVDNSETDQSNFTGMKYKLQTTCPVHISIRPPPDNKDKTTRNIWIIVSIFIAELISGAVFFCAFLKRFIKYRDMARTLGLESLPAGEEALRWAALERLPTYSRVRRGIFKNIVGDTKEIDVSELEVQEQKLLIDRLVSSADDDPEMFFQRVRRRFDAVDLEFPKIEVRFQQLTVESFVHIGTRALPTIPNFMCNMMEALLRKLKIYSSQRSKLTILDNVSGIIRPSRLTLLLGPPSSGKTTLLLALAGRLGSDLQQSGRITYNGHGFNEFVPQRTAAYVSQQDRHIAEITVRETLDFAGRCQGVGFKYDMLMELARREKIAGIKPDEDLDIFMKSLALGGQETSLVVEYIMKILGLDVCADTLVGDEMLKGISGGQKKRLTTGELLIGPARVLFMDEISTGLDSSTTYQIIKYLRHSTCALDSTTVVSLLQPAPETYELFDDVILLCEGQIIYQGPRDSVLNFFTAMGFTCPERKNVADFLQEVISKKDQEQYWSVPDRPYQFIPAAKFAKAFRLYHVGKNLSEELEVPFDRRYNHPASLSSSQYGVKRRELLKTSFSLLRLLMKRNSFIYVFKFVQLLLVAMITMSVFFRTTMKHDTIDDGGLYLGALYFSTVIILFNGFTEVSMLVAKLPVIYKHRDLHFYPSWIYTLPSWILSIPISLLESGIWVVVTYYVIGYDPAITRFLRQLLLLFSLHQMSIALFRLMGSLGRNMIVANTFGSFTMLVVMALGGYIISRDRIPKWWIWGFWWSPLMYAQNAASVNEFLGHSWDKSVGKNTSMSLGESLLKARSLFTESYWYWIGVGALLGYTVIFNTLFTFFLAYLKPLGKSQAVVSKEELQEREKRRKGETTVIELRHYLQYSGSLNGKYFKQRGMVLPFQQLSMSFSNINYYVDVPMELKQQGVTEERLQLLVNVSGSFRPGVLTALLGVSGAGKTTLMDVLAGRKTGGVIEGNIHISGYPKRQDTFARVSGYCEQTDIHSPCLTIMESLLFSAWLRLPSDVDLETQRAFVDEVMELVELTPLSGALVGLPGVDGLSTEQRKRLTIAVELVANPSIVFMDEPTSGLDARSAAIVMRTVRNIVNTGRTIVCTIHQPSIDIFESFDELLLMKRGGELIYAGPLGPKSRELIKYFEAVEGVPKIKAGYNPAAWMLEVTSAVEESRLGVDFAEVYRRSTLFQRNLDLVETLSRPISNSKELSFPTKYSQTSLNQFLACLWKQNLSYWRNPQYTAVKFFYTVIISLMLGTICWKFGAKRETQQDLFNAMGSLYAAVLFIGITNATAVQPVVSIERFVSYRERAAGLYSALPFAFAQVAIEFPYVFAQTVIYCSIFYSMAAFDWTILKFIWYIFFMYFTLLYFTFYGMMTTAITPNHNVGAIIAAPFYMLWNLFSGFMIPHKRIPIWWRWYYWANPVAWSLYGLQVSQYGDDNKLVKLSDGINSVAIHDVLKHVFGFRHDFLGVAAIMVFGFCLFFATIFAFAIKSFNFQRR